MNRLVSLAAAGATLGALVLLPALPADAAGTPTTIAFTTPTLTVGYASNWTLEVDVKAAYATFDSGAGTVNILIKGLPGVYESGIPLNDGGVAFVSPPSSKPPLGAGTYKLTAVFQPSGGSGFDDSQTTKSATLTVTPIAVQSSATIVQTVRDNTPTADVVAKLTAAKGVTTPAGTWTVKVLDAANGATSTVSADLAAGATAPTTLELPSSVKPARSYTVTTTFEPDTSVSDGYAVTNAAPQTLNLPDSSIVQVLTNPTPEPYWLLAALGLVLLALIAVAIILLVTRKPRPAVVSPAQEPAETTSASEPTA